MRSRAAVIAAVLVALPIIAHAQEPAPSPPTIPAEPADVEKAVRVAAYTWSKVAVGAPDAAIRFGGGVEVRGPIAIGKDKAGGAMGLRFDVDTLPDKGGDVLEDLGSWGNYAEVEGFFTKRVGSLDVAGGRVSTSVLVFGRTTFGTIGGGEDAPEDPRALRAYGLGVELSWSRGQALDFVAVSYCRDEAVGPRGVGQLCAKGSLTLRGPVRFVGELGIGFGALSHSGEQRDYLTAGVGVNLTEIF